MISFRNGDCKILRDVSHIITYSHHRAQDLHWNEFSRWDNEDPALQERHGLTGPKPDITYGFPIYLPDDRLPPALAAHDWAQLFSCSNLQKLHQSSKGKLKAAPNTKVEQCYDHICTKR